MKYIDRCVGPICEAGYHIVTFDGGHLSSGTYFVKLDTEGLTKVQKMTLIKGKE